MARESSREEIPEKVWLPWVQEGPYLVRHQHLVARDEAEVSLCPVPLGRQVRGLAKATLEQMRAGLAPEVYQLAREVAGRLVQARPWRLLQRELVGKGHSAEQVLEALMALCRAGLVVVFFRNRRRFEAQWEARHVELTNWGKALLISIEAVPVPFPRTAQRAAGNGAAGRAAEGRKGKGTAAAGGAAGQEQAAAAVTARAEAGTGGGRRRGKRAAQGGGAGDGAASGAGPKGAARQMAPGESWDGDEHDQEDDQEEEGETG
ncbi:MAG TPA: hypothetical protein VIL11_02730 [Limnochordales bacterium]